MNRRNFLKYFLAFPVIFLVSKLLVEAKPAVVLHSEMKKESSPEWFENNKLTIPPNVEVYVNGKRCQP